MQLSGQRVVIVGGTSGIGLAVAARSLALGAEVVVASSRQASVEAAVAQLGDGATGQTVEVMDPGAVAEFFDSVGSFDHLVYTAGEALSLMYLDGLTLEQARMFFQTRYFGALTVVQAGRRSLRSGGSITLTSGSAAARPGAGWAVPASVCGAIDALTRALAVELAPIRVNAVAPGVVRSPLWSRLDSAERDAMYASVAAALPVGRVGLVDDVATAYLYCLLQRYGTGTILGVDGGALLV
jgi:NAD(P)-dependent dehydrogenase (short-subunit alcohol dehydrogenase family)